MVKTMAKGTKKIFLSTAIFIGIVVLILGISIYAYQSYKLKSNFKLLNELLETNDTNETNNWLVYIDPVVGFAFKYPTHFTIFDGNNGVEWKEQQGRNKLTVRTISMNNNKIDLGIDLNHFKKGAIESAIKLRVSPILSETPYQKVSIETLGKTNFLRVFPRSQEGCFCWMVEYLTVVDNYFVRFDSHVLTSNEHAPITYQELELMLKDNNNALIEMIYGDIEGILATFQSLE